MSLAERTCIPCRGGVPPLGAEEIDRLKSELHGWSCVEERRLVKEFALRNFAEAMHLANQIAKLAEAENHHPDLHVRWGGLTVELWTYKIDGLTESDFILAAKIDRLTEAPA